MNYNAKGLLLKVNTVGFRLFTLMIDPKKAYSATDTFYIVFLIHYIVFFLYKSLALTFLPPPQKNDTPF